MSVDATHDFFFAWLHQASQLVRFKAISLHFDLPNAVLGDLTTWAGPVNCLFMMDNSICPDGRLVLTLDIPERGADRKVSFACTASADDLRRACVFLHDFSHQVSTPQADALPAVVIEDLTNVAVFPRQTLGPWFERYEMPFFHLQLPKRMLKKG